MASRGRQELLTVRLFRCVRSASAWADNALASSMPAVVRLSVPSTSIMAQQSAARTMASSTSMASRSMAMWCAGSGGGGRPCATHAHGLSFAWQGHALRRPHAWMHHQHRTCSAQAHQHSHKHAAPGPGPGSSRSKASVNSATKALQQGIKSHVAEFQISPDEAVQRYEQYQLRKCMGFQDSGLLSGTQLVPSYLPFWSFGTTITAKYICQLGRKRPGHQASGDSSDDGMTWQPSDWVTIKTRHSIGHNEPSMQVYASYLHPRLLAEGLQQGVAAVAAATASTSATTSATAASPVAAAKGAAVEIRGLSAHEANALSIATSHSVWSSSSSSSSSRRKSSRRGAEAAAAGSSPGNTSGSGPAAAPEEEAAAEAEAVQKVPVQEPAMPQGLAWHLAARKLTQQLVEEATRHARQQHLGKQGPDAVDAVKDVHIEIEVHDRSVLLVYFPAYLAHYQHGTRYKQGTSGVIVPQMFHALIGGTASGGVSATTHVSPLKTAAAVGAATAAAGTAAAAAASHVLGSFSHWGTANGVAEAVVVAVLAGALAGSWARGLPQAAKNKTAAAQAAADSDFYARYDKLQQQQEEHQKEGSSAKEDAAGSTKEDYMLWLWADADWRRWEGDEPWNWDPAGKQQEAERLWRQQLARPLERKRHREQQQQAAERLQEEQQRQQQQGQGQEQQQGQGAQEQRYGRHHHWRNRQGGGQYGHGRPATRDFLGYYKILGVDPAVEDSKTTEGIKAAFKVQAMQLHPDRFNSAAADEKKQAHVRFQKLQMAYDVLRDPEKRKLYDRGQLIH